MTHDVRRLIERVRDGHRPTRREAYAFTREGNLSELMECAAELRDRGHGKTVSYSRKVFIPLTHLCRDFCSYCTFARPPAPGEAAYMREEEVLAVARRGEEAGCKEALFTLGDKPERRYKAARQELERLGHRSTLSYLEEMARRVLEETSLLPHLNPGLLSARDLERLRPTAPSMGLMLETISERLGEKGMAHYGSPDKVPVARLETLRWAGEASVPFTSGILIGIGETREERIEALLALRELHERYGHLQEVIIQNFRAKPGTRMARAPEPTLEELLWSIAVARLLLGPEMNIQAPPNLSGEEGALPRLLAAGINDWGGVSPVTPDYVNPEAPWPHLDALADETARAGKLLVERLTIYPSWARDPERWLDESLRSRVLQAVDSSGFARSAVDEWVPGAVGKVPPSELALLTRRSAIASPPISGILRKARGGETLSEEELVRLFESRGEDFTAVCRAADELREETCGDTVTYVVNRNINYTNVCYFRCQFCAFSKGKLSENLRGRPYDLTLEEIQRRSVEAWERGATEVCMQGGIHPDYTGETYLEICRAVKEAVPGLHVHAFSPLEVWQGAATVGIGLTEFLERLRDAGLGTLPGTAAEILDDEVRAILCPDKIDTAQWLSVMEAAHHAGFRTTATIMYGHVESPKHWARHLLRLRELQARTGGFTELVPLPFVHMEAPLYLKGRARRGPTFREAVLMHAVSRLALHPGIRNIQVSWVKMGPQGVKACLGAGANDLGGTLMNESITRAAGASWGEELPPARMEELIREIGRRPRQRTTDYGPVPAERVAASFAASPLEPVVKNPAVRYERGGRRPLVRPGLDAARELEMS